MSGQRVRARLAGKFSRRYFVHAGSLGLVGLSLPDLLRAANRSGPLAARNSARSCILFFLEGGPAHQDLWDMKPEAPAEVRGEFQPIATTAPDVLVCEHLPMLARQMHRIALIRSVHHKVVDHNAGTYYALTGRSPVAGDHLIVSDEPDNFPPVGAVLSRLFPQSRLPEFVQLPEIMSNNGHDLPGQRSGFFGAAYNPFVAGDPSVPGYQVPGLALPEDISTERLDRRRRLLERIDGERDRAVREDPAWLSLDVQYSKAFDLLSSPQTQTAFDLSREPMSVRRRYGLPDRVDRSVGARSFGGLPHLGQCMLQARRLIEAGVRLVTVCTGRRFDQSWDTHRDHFPLLRRSLLPYVDRAFSALVEDLSDRGLFDETLIVAMGEFGRTPRLGQITTGAGADDAGRDHWPHCYTVLMAGGGVKGGVVVGASDDMAAYPVLNPVTPEDVTATIYSALGLDPQSRITDYLNRPHALSLGDPILDVFA